MDIQPTKLVYLASFAALLGALSMGFCLGYSSPAIVQMGKDSPSFLDSDDKSKRDRQESLIGSMLNIGALFGGILGEPFNRSLGRKRSLVAYGIPFVAGWLIIATSKSVTQVVIGRILTGLCCGLVSQTAPTYVVEIAPPNIRGMLGTCFQVMVTVGILFAPIFSTAMSWQASAIVCSLFAVAMSVMMIFMPETPQWLLSKEMNVEAEDSLRKFRATAINEEFSKMSQIANNNRQNADGTYSVNTLKSREFLRPFGLAIALMFFQQFSGINGILFYQGTIFEKAVPDLKPIIGTIIVCVAQVIATVIGSQLVDRLGRRILLIASGVGHAIALIMFGFYQYKVELDSKFAEHNAWMALMSLIMFVTSFSIGYGPIPWMIIPELSSAKVRSLIASISTAFNWTCSYVVTATIKDISKAIGAGETYWLYAVICAASCVFVGFLLPETKGRSEEQIQAELLGNQNQNQEMRSKNPESSYKQSA